MGDKYILLFDYKGEFHVEKEWLEKHLGDNHKTTIKDFFNSYTCYESEQIYNQAVVEGKALGIQCPLCEGFMRYKIFNSTVIYTCELCPGVLVEYHLEFDYQNLGAFLSNSV